MNTRVDYHWSSSRYSYSRPKSVRDLGQVQTDGIQS
jgi:hypothetical protein